MKCGSALVSSDKYKANHERVDRLCSELTYDLEELGTEAGQRLKRGLGLQAPFFRLNSYLVIFSSQNNGKNDSLYKN